MMYVKLIGSLCMVLSIGQVGQNLYHRPAGLLFQFQLTEGQAPDFCRLRPKEGMCRAAFFKYFYNPRSQNCEKFTYGGCDGNANNFDTHSDCMSTCRDVDR